MDFLALQSEEQNVIKKKTAFNTQAKESFWINIVKTFYVGFYQVVVKDGFFLLHWVFPEKKKRRFFYPHGREALAQLLEKAVTVLRAL